MDYRRLFLSLRGRISRRWYWVGTVLIWAATNALGFLAQHSVRTEMTTFRYVRDGVAVTEAVPFPVASDPVNILIWILTAVFAFVTLYVSLAVHTKRWHDRNKSGWWSLIIFIPVVGWVWIVVECGFLRGDEGTNRFGTDPLDDPIAALDRSFGYEV